MDAIKKFFSTITGAQWFTLIVVPAAITAINTYLPAGAVHDALIILFGGGGVQSLVSNRRPSADGGTVSTSK